MTRRLFPVLALAAITAATPAAAEWREASSENFIIYADSGERWLRDYAERMERAAAAMRVLQPGVAPTPSARNRLVIYVLDNEQAVQRVCGKCGQIAGFYVPRVGHSVAFTGRGIGVSGNSLQADTVLFHEYAHHAMYSSQSSAMPRWYSEGFAEFFSTMRPLDGGSVEVGRPAVHRAYGMLNERMDVSQLLAPTRPMSAMEQDIFYGRAWMLTHMLTFAPDRKDQLKRYLVAINTGKPILEAAQAAFGDLKTLQRDMDRYVTRGLTYLKLPPDLLRTGTVTLRQLTPGQAAMMPVRIRSDRGVDREQAVALVGEARKIAAAYPADAGVQAALAEAEYDAGELDKADAAADRALAADSTSMAALTYKGRVAVDRAMAARSTDPTTWKAARGWYLKANKLETEAAEPLYLFYTSFVRSGQNPTANAKAAVHRALELSPQDRGLRFTSARQDILDGKLAEARRTLLTLAFDPHIPADKNAMARVVAMIDAGKPASEIIPLVAPGRAD